MTPATAPAPSIADFVATAFAPSDVSDWQQRVINDDSRIRPANRPDSVADAAKTFHDIVVVMVDPEVDSNLTQERDA
jgi:hypothetical protein